MAELHDALKYLGGVEWDGVPQDHDGLAPYMTDCFTAGELICNSVPHQPDGTLFAESKPHHRTPNTAKSHQDIHSSSARPDPPHEEHACLQKHWGKPIKLKPAENPLNVSIYKMAGNDRHGAWFARRSTHEGLGFEKWKRAMLREFPQSMSVSGGPGAGAIRGLAADRRLERIQVPGVGNLEVYELSAQFPGPVTPRDFMTMLLCTENALSDKSATEVHGSKHVPRHYMVVSRPIEHPDAPMRSGFVRGHYESVELIREIPLSAVKSKSNTTSGMLDEQGNTGNPELNPVEWIMITRSDPGGGIPRFLVERGTPEAMITDLHKFFDWTCSLDHIPDPDEDLDEQQASSKQELQKQSLDENSAAPVEHLSVGNTEVQHSGSKRDRTSEEVTTVAHPAPQQGGIMNNLTRAIGAGIDSYAPTTVAKMIHSRFSPSQELELSDDSSDSSSMASFLSAEEMRRLSTAPEDLEERPPDSADTLSIASAEVSEASKDPKNMNHHEKEVLKLAQKRQKLLQQLAKKRLAEESKLKQSQEKEELDVNKQKEEMEKRLKKTEEKHRKEIERLEAKKAKEARKVEEKRRKKDEQYKLSLVARERDEFRSQRDLYRRENDLLREQVADIQMQNNLLAQKLGKIGGQDTLKAVQEEMAHRRSRSMKSVGSMGSSESIPRSENRKHGGDSGAS